MPRIDPLQLLNCLNVLLTPNGGIKSEQEVARISSLMEKFSKKLVSKCVYLLILKASDVRLLSQFMGSGGWNLIYSWLVHAIEAKNYPFLIELLEVIIICPVDIERLKSNPMPRQIKNLSKDSIDSRVKELASDIVKHWLAIVKGAPAVGTTTEVTQSDAHPVTTSESEAPKEDVELKTEVEDAHEGGRVSSDGGASAEEEGKEDGVYVQSTSPSSCSLDSDDSDTFVPYKKPSTKKKVKGQKSPSKKEKLHRSSSELDRVRLKSKLIEDKDSKKTLKMKIEKKRDEGEQKSKHKEEKSLEEKIKEKRRLREDKEREKFARLKQEREKKEMKQSKEKRDKNAEKGKEGKEEKSKGDISKLIPKSIDKLGRIPKLAKDSEKTVTSEEIKRKEETKKTEKPASKKDEATRATIQRLKEEKEKEAKKDPKKTSAAVPPKKPVSMSVEKRFATGEAKPKTVKAYNSKFRLTGLEQEVTPKPPSRKNAASVANATSSATAALKRSPAKDAEIEPAEKKLKSPEPSIDDKLPVPSNKVKKPFIQESDVFMNAMNVALESQKELTRKRKKTVSKGDDVSSPTSKSEKDAKPAFKFYKDTLESSVDDSLNDSVAEKESPPLDDQTTVNDKDTDNAVEETKPLVIKSAEGLKSALALFRTRKHPKKSVKWKSEEELEAVQYFEVDVSERANVVKDFWAMQLKERSNEREFLLVRKTENDKMTEKIAWRKPMAIDIAPPTTIRGVNSQEKSIQYARERAVPPALFYNKSMIPETPAEPDLEIHPVTVPPSIPLDDISGSQDSVNDFSDREWPKPKQFPPDGSEFNAMAANFMAAGVPPPLFPFPDGSFPPPFGQPFFPGGPVPAPNSNWTPSGNGDQPPNQNQWMRPPFDGPPNMVPPPVGPGMMGPPPFGMMASPFPLPGGPFPAPNMFPPPAMNAPINNNGGGTDNQSYQPNNNYNAGNSDNKKWNNDDRYPRKEGWKNNYSSDKSRDKRNPSSWRGSGGSPRVCKYYLKKRYCNVSGCRFYHPDK